MSGISDGISRTLGVSLCVHGLSPLLAWASSQHWSLRVVRLFVWWLASYELSLDATECCFRHSLFVTQEQLRFTVGGHKYWEAWAIGRLFWRLAIMLGFLNQTFWTQATGCKLIYLDGTAGDMWGRKPSQDNWDWRRPRWTWEYRSY